MGSGVWGLGFWGLGFWVWVQGFSTIGTKHVSEVFHFPEAITDPRLDESFHGYDQDAKSSRCYRNVGETSWELLVMCPSTQPPAAMVKRDSIQDFPCINEVPISLQFISVTLQTLLSCQEICFPRYLRMYSLVLVGFRAKGALSQHHELLPPGAIL